MAWYRVVLLIDVDEKRHDTPDQWDWPSVLDVSQDDLAVLSAKPLEATEPDPTPDDVLRRVMDDTTE